MPPTGTFVPKPGIVNAGFEPAVDPTGHNHPCIKVWFETKDGVRHSPELYMFEHNTGGWKVFTANGADPGVFEVDENGRIVVQAP